MEESIHAAYAELQRRVNQRRDEARERLQAAPAGPAAAPLAPGDGQLKGEANRPEGDLQGAPPAAEPPPPETSPSIDSSRT
jgi:hypothetical protein